MYMYGGQTKQSENGRDDPIAEMNNNNETTF